MLEQVRAACKEVVERATHVRVETERIPHYATALPLEQAKSPELDPRDNYVGTPSDMVAFVLTLDTINFGSGYFPHLRKRPNMSGYFTIASALQEHFVAHGAFTAQELIRLTPRACAEILGQDLNDAARSELMSLFSEALNGLGEYLLTYFDGQFIELVEKAESSAEKLVQLLARMPYFQDVAQYKGLKVSFYKRAQLTAADLSLRFHGRGPGSFHDLDRLTIFADNAVPNVLRVDGILRYTDSLASRIEAGDLIPAGCEEEVEIRAAAVHAVELIVGELRSRGHHLSAMQLDFLLWNRGQQPHYKASPRHRTRTIFY
jgi:hypothetical protein